MRLRDDTGKWRTDSNIGSDTNYYCLCDSQLGIREDMVEKPPGEEETKIILVYLVIRLSFIQEDRSDMETYFQSLF